MAHKVKKQDRRLCQVSGSEEGMSSVQCEQDKGPLGLDNEPLGLHGGYSIIQRRQGV